MINRLAGFYRARHVVALLHHSLLGQVTYSETEHLLRVYSLGALYSLLGPAICIMGMVSLVSGGPIFLNLPELYTIHNIFGKRNLPVGS